jgi:hypothetical protein
LDILIIAEESGVVREAFKAKGHNVTSCDILPTAISGKHYQGDFMDIINDGWDAAIAFTPCTFSTNSGVRWLKNADGSLNIHRYQKMIEYASYIKLIEMSGIPLTACENPIPHKYALEYIGRKYDQIIQPWQFGHGEQKSTCLWLRGLPKLQPTNIVEGREQKIWKMPPGPDRSKLRSKTYPGIAKAMAEQWGSLIQ